jgi:hypothetical protein
MAAGFRPEPWCCFSLNRAVQRKRRSQKMSLDEVIAKLELRYGALPAPTVRQRKRRSVLDQHLDDIRAFTIRMLYAKNPGEFTFARLTRELREKSGQNICEDTVRNYLIRHNLCQLWRHPDADQ